MINHKKDAPEKHDKVADKAAEGPPVQEYPKMLYNAEGGSMTVADKEAEAQAAKDGFTETPAPAAEAKDKDWGRPGVTKNKD